MTRVLDMMTVTEVAEALDIRRQSIYNARSQGGHALFDKGFTLGGRRLMFFREDVENYIRDAATAGQR
ncbi:excise [Gordonia phage ObLaDi]|uniref:Excise n=1 Tax=Gordonia phage ObLaDi TaxID=2978487 RepID=A0A977KN40_9CAUD|nr:excise [Gordonia phage ObLaDi]